MSAIQMEEFNINELAGATGLILGAVSGILVVIFKSRCHCKFRIGCSDTCNICMCERKPPPDNVIIDSDDENKNNEDKSLKKEKKVLDPKLIPKKSNERQNENETQPEPEIDKLI
jgi:hypothetical protein